MFWGAISRLGRGESGGEHQAGFNGAKTRVPEVKEGVSALGEVRGVNVLQGFLQRTRLHQAIYRTKQRSDTRITPPSAKPEPRPRLRTVDEEDQDAFLHGIISI